MDFYITDDSAPAARLRLACRLAEKAYASGQRVFVSTSDDAESVRIDELLWTFADGSFVPHSILRESTPADDPVLLGTGPAPESGLDVVVNLANEVPACTARANRVIEIIDGDAARRTAGRARFKAYREMGCELTTHELRQSATRV